MTNQERKDAQNERKRKSREKIAKHELECAKHELECGKQTLSLEFDAYRGTLEQIERLKSAGGFEDVNELLTIMIRNISRLDGEKAAEILKI